MRLRQVPERSDIQSSSETDRARRRQERRGREREERKKEEKRKLDRGIRWISTVMATETTSCTGSSLLQPLSDMIDLPLDQVNSTCF